MTKKSDPTQLPRVQALHALIPKLKQGDQNFANSLCDSFRRWGKLSAAQMEWVEKLILRATEPPAPPLAEATIEGRKIPGINVAHQLLYGALQHIQFPVIRLITQKRQKFTLRPFRHHMIKLSVTGKDAWGKIEDEVLDMRSIRYLPDPEDILNCLFEFAAHPREMMLLYSKKTSSCMFCGLGLENPQSVAVGYGPICAENYGLPWGEQDIPKVDVGELEALLEAQLEEEKQS